MKFVNINVMRLASLVYISVYFLVVTNNVRQEQSSVHFIIESSLITPFAKVFIYADAE